MFVEWTAGKPSTSTNDKDKGKAEKRDMVEGEENKDRTDSIETKYTITPNTNGYKRVKTVTTKKTKITVNTTDKKTTLQKHTVTETTTTTFTKEDGVSISKYNTDGITIGKTSGVVPKLIRITFNREVYKPNQVVADIQLTASSTPSIDDVKTLLGKEVKVLRYTAKIDGTSISEATDNTYTGFYIYDVLPLKASGKELVVRAHIFSLDHQLTRKKYSRTYVAKKLFEDILLEGVNESTTTDYKLAAPNYFWKPSCLKLPFPTYYGKVADKIDRKSKKHAYIEVDNKTDFDHLFYTVLKKKDGKKIDKLDSTGKSTGEKETVDIRTAYERIQPYLVQYNESFYDFMVRTCNRCGEFFFWDNGALRLGRTAKGTESSIDTSKCLSVYYTAIHTPDTETSFENEYYTLDDLNDLSEAPDLNSSSVGEKLNTIDVNDGFFYNDEVNHDIYRTRIYQDRFDSFNDEMVGNANKYGVSFMSKILNSTSVFDIVKGYGVYEIFRTTEAAAAANHANTSGNEDYIYSDKRPNVEKRTDTTKGKEFLSLFTTADTAGHLDSEFYHTIRKEEERLSRQLIVFNLSEPKDFAIGQEITYEKTTYVIIQIKDNPATNNSKKDYFSDIDSDASAPFAQMGSAVMQVVAIPLGTSDIVYPPLHPAGHIRHSEPQVALVKEFRDPQKRGRVRIVYPWQQWGDTEPSPWIKVLTPSSVGAAFEFIEGSEVLIDYESGNIERPYVAGSLFNRKNTSPSRGDMALVSRNGHSIKFSNPEDSTLFLAGVSPTWSWLEKYIDPIQVGEKDQLKLTGGITLSDSYGFYKIAMSTDQRKIDIASPFGNVKISALTGISISAPNGDISIKGQNINIEAGNKLNITSGTNIKNKSYVGFLNGPNDSPQTKEDNLKNFFATLLGEKVFEGTMDFIKPLVTGVDLNLLRTIIQVFLRPIDGTLEIHSYKYMLLEAGKGEATVEPNRYKTDKIRENHLYNNPTFSSAVNVNRNLEGYHGIHARISTIVDSVINAINTRFDEVNQAKTDYNTARSQHTNTNPNLLTADEIINANKEKKQANRYNKKELKFADAFSDRRVISGLTDLANDLAGKVCTYYQAIINMGDECERQIGAANLSVNHSDTQTILYDTMKKKAKGAMKKVISFAQNTNHVHLNNLSAQEVIDLKKYAKRIWFETIIKEDSLILIGKPLKEDDASNWTDFVDNLSIDPTWQSKLKAKTIGYIASIGTQYTDVANQTFRDWDRWDSNSDGQIIYSEKSDESYYFDDSQAPKKHKNGYNEGTNPTVTIVSLQGDLRQWN